MLSPRLQASGFNLPGDNKADKNQVDDIVELKKGLGLHSNDNSVWAAGEAHHLPYNHDRHDGILT